MAKSPVLQLVDISLGYGGDPLFKNLSVTLHEGERVALVGRNGSGKSTLMKIMAGFVEPDQGDRILPSGTYAGYMEQEPDMSGYATLGDFAADGLPDAERYKIEMVSEGLKFDPERPVETASGGERRRAALAKLLATEPDVLLLDEPTNHMDIEAIQWLENYLKSTQSAFVLISHDRAFLNALTRNTFWVDRGEVRMAEVGFGGFEAWREKIWEEEDQYRHKLNRKIKEEARWAVEGISARRKRNQGRVRALQELRSERASQIKRQGTAAMALEASQKSGRKVVVAEDVQKSYDDKPIVKDFSITVQRGDRIAFVGPNGIGKTTLLKMILGLEAPDRGTIKLGTNLDVAFFDQARAQLDPSMTLWESLTGDPDMRVSGKADQVLVRGQPKHVVGYLKEFLFDEGQARAPVRSLSGGEKARLLLAKLMARPANFLVLDEPTNDLDIETLDLLQELITDFDGTVVLVSHDRDFIDRTVTTTVAFEGQGVCTVYAGGWSDYQHQKSLNAAAQGDKSHGRKGKGADKGAKPAAQAGGAPAAKLSYTQKHRLEALPAEIARIEAEIAKLSDLLSDADLFTREPVKFNKATEMLIERQSKLEAAEEEWLMLEDLSQSTS